MPYTEYLLQSALNKVSYSMLFYSLHHHKNPSWMALFSMYTISQMKNLRFRKDNLYKVREIIRYWEISNPNMSESIAEMCWFYLPSVLPHSCGLIGLTLPTWNWYGTQAWLIRSLSPSGHSGQKCHVTWPKPVRENAWLFLEKAKEKAFLPFLLH